MRFVPFKVGLPALLLAFFCAGSASAGSGILEEDFEGAFPPAGWSAIDDSEASLNCAWKRSDDYTLTGLLASSLGAAVDSNQCTPVETPDGDVDTSLVSPQLDLTGSVGTVLSYDIAYRHFFPSSAATFDVSTDGGASWTTLATYNSSPPISEFTPEQVVIDFSAYDGEPSVTLRWRYTSGHGWWVFVDNVILGPAGPGALAVNPAALDFGDVHTGIRTTLEVTVANTANPGDADLALVAIDSSGDPEFELAGGDCEAGVTVLGPGESCIQRVRFRPSAVGTFSGQLVIGADDSQSLTVPLAGTGIPTSRISVDPPSLSAMLEIGASTSQAISITNLGTEALDWEIPLVHGDLAGDATRGSTGDLLRQGLLLVPNAGRESLVALDPATGDVVDPDFLETGSLGFGSKPQALMHPDGEHLLLSHQTDSVVHSFDAEGNYVGIFAPAGGADTGIMQNIRGMAIHPLTGNILVASAPFNGTPHGVVEFDPEGNYLGRFIDADVSGVTGYWSIVFRDTDMLVSAGNNIHAFHLDGSYIGIFNDTPMNFLQQIVELDNGHVLAANSQGGVWEFDADGTHIGNHAQFGSVAGVYPLPNGNLLVSANTGVHEIDMQGNIVRDVITGGSSMFSLVKALDCTVPDWLTISPTSGSIAVGGAADEVLLTFDASGLTPGVHETVVCVDSNDPARPRLQVPVSLTVEQPGDFASIEGTVTSAGHCGAETAPLGGATVEVSGVGGASGSAITDDAGFYEIFLPSSASPVDIAVSAPGHLGGSADDVAVGVGQTVIRDFELELDAPCITVADASYHFDVLLGDGASDSLTIGNADGAGSLEWSIGEGPGLAANPDPRAHFPSQRRIVEHKQDADVSAGADPRQAGNIGSSAVFGGPSAFQVPAYSTTSSGTPPGYIALDALVPEAFTVINAEQPTTFFAGTFIRNDFDNHYMLAGAGGAWPLNTFGRTSTATGEFTPLGTVTGAPAATGWNTLKWDHTTGMLYAVANLDELFVIDPASLEATFLGRITGPGVNPDGAVVVAIAIAPDGLMYALDLVDDVLLAVDKTNAEAAVIGSVGMDANFAQDMDFDQTTGILYWAAYNSGTSRMFKLDTDTGAGTPIGDIQGRTELMSFSIARPGGGCSTPEEIPWLSVSDTDGTTAPHGSSDVTVSVSTAGLAHGHHEAFLCVASNDPASGLIRVPVSIDVTDADAGFLEGTVTGTGHCGQDPQPLDGAVVSITGAGTTFEVRTDSDGFYRVPINDGESPVDITVSASGHLPTTVSGVVIEAGVTHIEDVELASQTPCISVEPGSIDAEAAPGGTTSRVLTIGNVDGHADLDWAFAMAGRDASGILPRGEDIRMSQTSSTAILPEFSAGCPIGANHVLRRFYFDEYPGVGNRINSVDVAILDAAASAVVSVNLYTLPSGTPVDTIPLESLQRIGAVAAPISAADNGTIVNVPIDATVGDIEASDLVVEVVSSGLFYIGANDAGETHPGFVMAPSCGMTEPTRLDQVEGFENTHVVLMVNAESGGGCAPPEDVPWLSVDQAAGTTAAGSSSDVAVNFDASGLTKGDYDALLCISSNDPVRSRVEVPVHLSVVDDDGDVPVIAVAPGALVFSAPAGGADADELLIGNVGGGILEWSIDTAEPAHELLAIGTSKSMALPSATMRVDGGGSPRDAAGPLVPHGGMSMSQTPDTDIAAANSVACDGGENRLLRRFYFDEHPGVSMPAHIESVDVAVQESGDTSSLTVNLYTLPAGTPVDTIPVEALALIGSGTVPVSTADDGSIVNVPVEATVGNTLASDLVVEVVGGVWYIGATDTSQTHPGFIVAPECGVTSPTPIQAVGPDFADTFIVMVVNTDGGGTDPLACDNPSSIPWLTIGTAAGSTAAGETDVSTITADATGLAPGIHDALLCVDSNDPVTPTVVTPIEFTVEGDPGMIFAHGFECEPGLPGCDGGNDEDVVILDDIDFVPNADFTGGAIRWLDGTTCDCDTAPFNFNVFGSTTTLQFFWPLNTNPNEGGVSVDGSTYAMLGSGDTIGPASQYLVSTAQAATAPWTTPGNVDGYLGFRFDNGGTVNYGYARITTGASGRPLTIVRVAYNNAGDPITIP